MRNTFLEQSPQADFDSPFPSLLRGALQDFGARAESRSDLPICELRIPRSVLSHRECEAISYETRYKTGHRAAQAPCSRFFS